jgi:hypothetical protein
MIKTRIKAIKTFVIFSILTSFFAAIKQKTEAFAAFGLFSLS